MNVLIIPEDFRQDQFILKPIIKAMLSALGKRRATVKVCRDPLLGGVTEAMKWERIAEIIDMYRTIQLFLLIVDRARMKRRKTAWLRRFGRTSDGQTSSKSLFHSRTYSIIRGKTQQVSKTCRVR